ncbi:hypothetical protein VZQ01_05895 [Myxococcus faecalis]|uniref:hypothetical protein n=1 Tax=Myxococcus faecalis TaxID=3115646 RepID=UPI003CF85770
MHFIKECGMVEIIAGGLMDCVKRFATVVVAAVLMANSAAHASNWVKRPEEFDPQSFDARKALEEEGNAGAAAVARAGSWAFATAAAMVLREKILAQCLLVKSSEHSSWRWTGFLPDPPESNWYLLGDDSCDGTAIPHALGVKRYDTSVFSEAVEKDIHLVATTIHPERSILLGSSGVRVADDVLHAFKKNVDDFVLEQARTRGFKSFLPVRDEYTSKAFFGAEELQFFNEIRVSGWGDRVAVTTEVIADRIGYGRLALSAAFAGSNSSGGEPALADEDDSKKDNLQKLVDNGGDIALSYRLPLVFAEKRTNTPGFFLLEFHPRLVTAIPALGSTIEDASFAVFPGFRGYLQAKGFDDSMGLYVDVWSGWGVGVGPNFNQYVDMKEFFVTTLTAGLRLMDRFNVGASYIVAGPLRSRNGVTLTITAITGPSN